MRDLPFADGCQTLARAFVITLSDGARHGFTDHDRPLVLDGVTCRPMAAADTEQRAGFDADSGAVRTRFDIDLSSDAIKSGSLDGARLDEYRVDWSDPSRRVLMTSGRLGEVSMGRDGEGFEADWLGRATLLDRSTGRVFSRRCDAELGDVRCGVDLSAHPDGTVCPRTLDACKSRFANAVNFRGFPYLLGDDALQAGVHLTPNRNGGSRYA